MPQFKLKAKDKKAIEKITQAFEKTEILQRQSQLTYGRWDFAVFGPAGADATVLRVGHAEHAAIQRAPLYVASLSRPGWMDISGVPIEEFVTEVVPEEYQGLEVIQVDPIRPLTIHRKETLPSLSQAEDKICREFEDANIALIRAPQESDWMISVMRYLNECDRAFPDRVQQALQRLRSSGGDHSFSFGSADTVN